MYKILAIDNQQDNLTTIKAVINSHMPDNKIITSLSGKEGIEIAKEEQPDTILLDIIMPDVDGYEVCKRLKSEESTKHIPIILITSIKTDSESRVKGLEIGADAFLSKPIDPIEFIAQIKVMLRIKNVEDKLKKENYLLEELVLERTYELSTSKQKYKALYDNAPLPYQSLDENGYILDINPTWLNVLGYKREEIIGNNYSDFLHPNWKSHFKENFTAFKKLESVNDVQYKIRHKDGHYLDISFEGCIGYHPDGRFKQTYCVFKDITDQKIAEDRLITNQYYLTKAQELGRIGTWEFDLKNNNLTWTEEVYKIFSVPLSTKTNYKLFLNCVHPDDRDYVHKKWSSALINNTYDIEHRIIVKGKTKWVREKADIEYDSNGKPEMAIGFTQDISLYKITEKELKYSEERFRQIIENSQELIWEVDSKGKYTFISPNTERMLGYKSNEIVGKKHFYDLFTHEEREKLKNAAFELFKQKKTFNNLENRNLTKDGRVIWLSTSAVPILDDNEELIGYRGADIDITEQKLSDQALKESELRFRTIINYATDAMFIIDFKGNIIETNKKTSEILGYSNYELLLMNMVEIDPAFKDDDFRKKVIAKLLKDNNTIIENYLKKKNGQYIPVESNLGIIELDNKKFILGFARDISKRKEAEAALKESEDKLRSILENSTYMIYSHTPDHVITYLSPQVENILGYTQDEALVKWTELASDNPINKAGLHITEKAIITGKRQPPYELELIKKDGTKIFVEVRESPQVKNERTIAITGSIIDITERKIVEKELSQYRENLEEIVKTRTKDLKEKNDELYRLNNLFVGREFRIKELRDKVKELENRINGSTGSATD